MTIPTISIADITTNPDHGAGTGVFDILYDKVKKEVTGEFTTGKLKGSEYAEVVLGSLTATLNQSMQFLFTRDELNYKLQILELEKKQQEVVLDKLKLEKDILVLNKDILEKNKLELDAKIDLMNLEKTTVAKQQALLDKQVATENQKVLNMAQELLLITAQKDLAVQQKANLVIDGQKLTQEVTLISKNALLVEEQVNLSQKNRDKITSEIALLTAKVTTENAQTTGTVGGLIGKQVELYEAQRLGFAEDASIKREKIKADVWSVARTTDPDATPIPPQWQ